MRARMHIANPSGNVAEALVLATKRAAAAVQGLLHSTRLDNARVLSETPTKQPVGMVEVYEQLAPLFVNDPELGREFLQYLPPSCYTSGHVHIQPMGPAEAL